MNLKIMDTEYFIGKNIEVLYQDEATYEELWWPGYCDDIDDADNDCCNPDYFVRYDSSIHEVDTEETKDEPGWFLEKLMELYAEGLIRVIEK